MRFIHYGHDTNNGGRGSGFGHQESVGSMNRCSGHARGEAGEVTTQWIESGRPRGHGNQWRGDAEQHFDDLIAWPGRNKHGVNRFRPRRRNAS